MINFMGMLKHCTTLHRLFRRLQQKNRFVGPVEHSGLTPLETHFLIELQADPERSIADISDLLAIDQSSGSRIASSFEKNGYVTTTAVAHDSRKKQLLLTKTGTGKINQIDSFADQLIDSFASNITKNEFKKLTTLLRLIGNGYGAPAAIRRVKENSFRAEQRRATRCFGLLGDSVFDSGFTATRWQALAEICLAPAAPQVTELALLLGVKQNSLTTVVDSLVKEELIYRTHSTHDRRASVLIATEAGRTRYNEIEKHATRSIKKGLSKQPSDALKKYVDIVRRFIGEHDATLPPLLPDFAIHKHRSPNDKRQARAFTARTFVKQNREQELPESFFSSNNESFSLLRAGKTVAMLELQSSKSSVPKILFASWDNAITPWVLTGFLNAVYFQQSPASSIDLERLNTAPLLNEYLFNRSL